MHLPGREDSIRIEVWDSAPNLPLLPDNAGSPVKRGCYALRTARLSGPNYSYCLSTVRQALAHSNRPNSLNKTPLFFAECWMVWADCDSATGEVTLISPWKPLLRRLH